eukprot:gene27748-36570_t
MLRSTFALILACLSLRYEGFYSYTFLRPHFLGYSGSRSSVIAPLQSSVMIEKDFTVSTNGVKFSSLEGKALLRKETPTLLSVKAALGSVRRSTTRSLGFAALDVLTVSACAAAGHALFPLAATLWQSGAILPSIAAASMWLLYSIVTGTAAVGMWVTAHECGHGAFSDNRILQTCVGYVFHSFLLVPYFSWQRSHAVHHANTNHISDGETHVPPILEEPSTDKQRLVQMIGTTFGEPLFGFLQLVAHLLVGWPAYLLFGATGGPSRGITNHFVPIQVSKNPGAAPLKQLFPSSSHKLGVLFSDIGVGAVLLGLYGLSVKFGFGTVFAAYGGPLLVVNAWLVALTWLQHTDVDVPHLPAEGYSFIKGALHTIDRPYDKLLWGTIPHYEAVRVTESFKKAFPENYLYESTPIHKALWRVATSCYGVEARSETVTSEDGDSKGEPNKLYVFVDRSAKA